MSSEERRNTGHSIVKQDHKKKARPRAHQEDKKACVAGRIYFSNYLRLEGGDSKSNCRTQI